MHVNFEPAKVIEASFEIVREMPAIADLLEGYKARTLNTVERRAFGEAALILKYDELEKAPVGAEKILAHRRSEDARTHALERAQRRAGKHDGRRAARLQPPPPRAIPAASSARPGAVKGLDENVRLNKALWHLAESLRASEPLTLDHMRDRAEVSGVN